MFHIQWNLLEIRADALILRDDDAHIQTLPLNTIAGYGTTPNGDAGHIDVILHNGSRCRVESQVPHDLAQVLDARFG